MFGLIKTGLGIGDLEIPCYVLEDGRRVLVQRGMMSALNMSQGTAGRGPGDRLARFAATKGISPYISKELREVITSPHAGLIGSNLKGLLMGIMAIAGAVAGIVDKGLGLLKGRQERKEREEHRDAGRNEQKVADSAAQLKQSRKAQENVEDVNRLSDDALDSELRKVARPDRK